MRFRWRTAGHIWVFVSFSLSPFSSSLVLLFVLLVALSFDFAFRLFLLTNELFCFGYTPPQCCLPACKSRNYLRLATLFLVWLPFLFCFLLFSAYLVLLMFSLSLSILFYPVFGYCRVPSVSAATRVSPLYVYDTCNMYARRSSFHLGLRCTVLFCHFVYKVQNADCLSFRRM